MVVSWDKTDNRVWFALWEDGTTPLRLYLVAEVLPFPDGGWEWTVWQAGKPTIVRRGTAPSGHEAADAAETAATDWRRSGSIP